MFITSLFALKVLVYLFLFNRPCSAASGTFDVLTYNIAGLPSFLTDNGVPGDKSTNAGTIGSKFALYGYDVIHVQEVSTKQHIYQAIHKQENNPPKGLNRVLVTMLTPQNSP